MKIKKIGHCCLFIQTGSLNILTDPGAYSEGQNNIKNIDVVLITHEHADHLHIESLKKVLINNSNALVLTNSGVGKILSGEGIDHQVLEGREILEAKNVLLEAFDSKHEEIFEDIGQVQNTGFFIDKRLFYPGDSYANPEKEVDILALPVAGPWCKVSDAIKYALSIKPKKVFPVHDGHLLEDRIGASHKIPEKVLSQNNIEFISMKEGDEKNF